MEKKNIVLPKGKRIVFLDYVIQNSLNNDGLVLMKEGVGSYEMHLGNYGAGTQQDVDNAKQAAILYFMIARPEFFATAILYRMMGDGGSFHEWYSFKNACLQEGIVLPPEVTASNDGNSVVWFNNHPIAWLR